MITITRIRIVIRYFFYKKMFIQYKNLCTVLHLKRINNNSNNDNNNLYYY